jgi:hypothetical protein
MKLLGASCKPCPENEFAHIGSASCSPRSPCTADDIEFLYTECSDAGVISKVASWNQPKICGGPGSVSLPATETGIPCFPCPPGFYRRPGSGDCVGCPDGNRLQVCAMILFNFVLFIFFLKENGVCTPCAAGTHAVKLLEVASWDEWPDWVHHATGRPLSASLEHGCRGGECSDEWRLGHDHIDSGPGHGFFAEPWLNFTVDLETAPSYFAFNFSFVNCSYFDCRVLVEVVRTRDGTLIDSQSFSPYTASRGMRTMEAGFHSFLLTFESGSHPAAMVRISNLRVYGARGGSAYDCRACRNGTASGAEQDSCRACPPGFASGAGQPWPCPPCPAGSVSESPGSSSCLACGRGTRPNAHQTDCETDCVFVA